MLILLFLLCQWLLLPVTATLYPPTQTHDTTHIHRRQILPPKVIWGPRFSIGPAKSGISKVSMIYVPGQPPSQLPVDNSLLQWSGLYDPGNRDRSDLVKTVFENHYFRTMNRACKGVSTNWCIRPVVVYGCCLDQSSRQGYATNATEQISIEYTRTAGMWTQTAWNLGINGTAMKQLYQYRKGATTTKTFTIETETRGGWKGSVDIQVYYNITITLDQPEWDFGFKMQRTGKIESDAPQTPDGGKTWVIQQVNVLPMVEGIVFNAV